MLNYSGNRQTLVLGDQLDWEQLKILRDHGLRDKYPTPFYTYDQMADQAGQKLDQDNEEVTAEAKRSLEAERPEIEAYIRQIAKAKMQDFRL